MLLNAELKEIKPEEYKELLEGFVDLFFCTSPPSRESLININEVYDAAYSTDENIKYLKDDIDFIYNQGKAVFENDSRKFSEKEIKKVVNYIKNCTSFTLPLEEKNQIKKLYEKLIKLKPEYEKELGFYIRRMFVKYTR
ncbi:MAG: hypothetical protein BWY64_03233 [bacterium ADurb.Bin363]|nr:MAG: hypothetical protein BWY64_03233 [bacterium ADurb.Bin363]